MSLSRATTILRIFYIHIKPHAVGTEQSHKIPLQIFNKDINFFAAQQLNSDTITLVRKLDYMLNLILKLTTFNYHHLLLQLHFHT